MKRLYYITMFVLLGWIHTFAQSVYMHEAQEEASESNFIDTLFGFAIFVSVICVISKISDNYKNRKEIKRKIEWEKEIQKKIEEEKIARDKFAQSLTCKNTIDVGGFQAIDLGLGDEFGNPMFATMNLGAKSQFENGSIYGWGMNRPAQLQKLSSYGMEPCPIKLKTLEELEIISGGYGSYKGEFDYDAASKEMNGLWFTPDSDELNELMNKCDWQFIDKFDIVGWKVTGPNSNLIFSPLIRITNITFCLLVQPLLTKVKKNPHN